jgi:hypothetical protein
MHIFPDFSCCTATYFYFVRGFSTWVLGSRRKMPTSLPAPELADQGKNSIFSKRNSRLNVRKVIKWFCLFATGLVAQRPLAEAAYTQLDGPVFDPSNQMY